MSKKALLTLSTARSREAVIQILPRQHWAVVGRQCSGIQHLHEWVFATATADIQQRRAKTSWETLYTLQPANHWSEVSANAQRQLIERERLRDDSDLTDDVFHGTPVRALLEEACPEPERINAVTSALGLDRKIDTGFRKLSSGETRKLLLARCLLSDAPLVVLDHPFQGMDVESLPIAGELLEQHLNERAAIWFCQSSTLPPQTQHLAIVVDGNIVETGPATGLQYTVDTLFTRQETELERALPDSPGKYAEEQNSRSDDKALVRMRNINVSYQGADIITDLNWEILPDQHWRVSGPNGSGKTTLLNLITGDHPQCYNNDIEVFGYQRGSGESIWDIKRHLGFVNASLQWEYRVGGTAVDVIVSGLHDTIGVYNRVSAEERELALQWLQLLDMKAQANTAFQSLSSGDQRLLLIARAMIKLPHLLLLDEPCAGLDNHHRPRVLSLVEQLITSTPTTVVYVSHDDAEVPGAVTNELALSFAN